MKNKMLGMIVFSLVMLGSLVAIFPVIAVPGNAEQTQMEIDSYHPVPLANGYITGAVVNGGTYEKIQGATVTVNETGTSTTTNATGDFNITIAPGTYNLTATKSGLKTSYEHNVDVTSGNETYVYNIYLEPYTGTLKGTIKEVGSGNPIQYASVLPTGYLWGDFTEANGTYLFINMAVGDYLVNVTAIGYKNASVSVTILADQVTVKDIEMEKEDIYTKAVVKGQVVDKNTGSPISGATVTIGSNSTTTDSQGNFELTVDAGTYTMRVTKTGYNEFTYQDTYPAGQECTYTTPIRLTPSSETAGTVGGLSLLVLGIIISVILIVIIAVIGILISKKKKKAQAVQQPQYPQQPPPSYPSDQYGVQPQYPPQQYPQQYPQETYQQYPPPQQYPPQ